MYSKMAKISFITPTKNSAKSIELTINSVLCQNVENFEYIVIDGGSTDSTVNIVSKYSDKIKLICRDDKSWVDAVNYGINNCTGDYICIIMSDDYLEKDFYECVKDELSFEYILHGNIRVIIGNNKNYIQMGGEVENIDKGMVLNHPGMIVPKEIYKQHGVYSDKYKIASDWDFLVRLSKSVKFKKINRVLVNFRVGGLSSKGGLNLIRENFEIAQNNRKSAYNYYKLIKQYIIYFATGGRIFWASHYWRYTKYKINSFTCKILNPRENS